MKRRSLKTKLTLVIFITLLLTIFGISIVSEWTSEKAIHSNVREGLKSTSQSATKLIEESIRRQSDLVTSVAVLNRVREMELADWMEVLAEEAKSLGFTKMGFLDRDGFIHYPDEVSVKLDIRVNEYARKSLAGERSVSSVNVNRDDHTVDVIFAAPVKEHTSGSKVVGSILAHKDASFLTDVTDSIKFGENGYAWMVDQKGDVIAHPNRNLILEKENFIEGAKNNPDWAKLAEMVQEMIGGATGEALYSYKGEKRLFDYAPVEGTNWSLAVGALEQDAMEQLIYSRWINFGVAAVFLVLGIIASFVISELISKPIRETTEMLKDIAQGEGDLTKRLTVKTKDEVGELVHWFNTFVEKIRSIIQEISENSNTLSSASIELSTTSDTIASNAEEMTAQANSVAAASEQSSVIMQSISASAEEMSSSMTVVASAIEELSSSIREVAVSCQKESEIAENANQEAIQTSNIMAELGKAADSIGSVVDVIQEIAAQTNLLALNATIEAASAGEAGKGFAVVASEVKDLAKQTASATEDIRKQVERMQQNSGNAISAIQKIGETIGEINTISQGIVVSIEQQNSAVGEIANNVSGVNDSALEVTRNVTESANSLNEISRTILFVNTAANDTSNGIQQVNMSVEDLSKLATRLQAIVGQFKI